jgi:hypothetical protein
MTLAIRIFPPAGGSSFSFEGQTYSAAAGSYVDVTTPQNADHLIANRVVDHAVSFGWTLAFPSGVTADRPTATAKLAARNGASRFFIDTQTSAVLIWDNGAWRNVVSGAEA